MEIFREGLLRYGDIQRAYRNTKGWGNKGLRACLGKEIGVHPASRRVRDAIPLDISTRDSRTLGWDVPGIPPAAPPPEASLA